MTDNIQTAYLSAGPAQIRLKNGSPEYVVLDALGSPVASSTSGAFTWRELYTPFGEKTLSPAANDNDIGFTGPDRRGRKPDSGR